MKEMMLKLPVVEVSSSDDLWLPKHYPKNGRFIVHCDNDDVFVADLILPARDVGEVPPTGERLQQLFQVYVGKTELFDPEKWVLATDLENAKNAYQLERDRYEARIAEMKAQIEYMKQQHEEAMAEKEKGFNALIGEKEAELHERYAKLAEANDQKLAQQRMELEHEFEMKKMQLELETPKRFSQGEWISGKTLTEIVKALMYEKKEE